MDDGNQISQLYDFLGVNDAFKPKFQNHKVNPLDYPPLDKNKRIYLKLMSYFFDPINQLENFLSLDLTIWKT